MGWISRLLILCYAAEGEAFCTMSGPRVGRIQTCPPGVKTPKAKWACIINNMTPKGKAQITSLAPLPGDTKRWITWSHHIDRCSGGHGDTPGIQIATIRSVSRLAESRYTAADAPASQVYNRSTSLGKPRLPECARPMNKRKSGPKWERIAGRMLVLVWISRRDNRRRKQHPKTPLTGIRVGGGVRRDTVIK